MQNRYKYKDVSALNYKRNKKKRDTQIYSNEFKDDMRFVGALHRILNWLYWQEDRFFWQEDMKTGFIPSIQNWIIHNAP